MEKHERKEQNLKSRKVMKKTIMKNEEKTSHNEESNKKRSI